MERFKRVAEKLEKRIAELEKVIAEKREKRQYIQNEQKSLEINKRFLHEVEDKRNQFIDEFVEKYYPIPIKPKED